MKAMFIHLFNKNKSSLFLFLLLALFVPVLNSDGSLLYIMMWAYSDTYKIKDDEFLRSLPISFRQIVQAQLLYLLVSFVLGLICYFAYSFIRPYTIQEAILGFSIVFASSIVRVRKFYTNNPFLTNIYKVILFLVSFIFIFSFQFYPLVLMLVVMSLMSFYYFSLLRFNLKTQKEHYYVKA